MDRNTLFGGNPLAVIIRLVVLSIVVGIVLSALGIRPFELVDYVQLLIRRVYDLGFGAVETVFRWFLIGAVIVIPIWLIARFIGAFSSKTDTDRR